MTAFLLDTTVFIHQWKQDPRVVAWIEAAISANDELLTTSVNVAEVYAGAKPEDRPTWDAFFPRLSVVPISAVDGSWAGRTQYDLARKGVQVQLSDALIAAAAVARGLTVVTENSKDFVAMGIPVVALP
jgi:predicted nucleic acid-binding protein